MPALGRPEGFRVNIAPFALGFAQPRQAEPTLLYAFDPARQLNVLADGTLAADNPTVLQAGGTTTSTAGSKTHFDD